MTSKRTSQTHFLEKFPGKSKFLEFSIPARYQQFGIFDMFTNSIDGTDFFRKILAFSIQLFGSFSNSLSSKEKEIFDIDSSSEITVLEKCFFQICHNFTGVNLSQHLIFNNNDNKIIGFLLRNFRV